MANIIHLLVLASGILAYVFSNVNSDSGFYNTFLPFVVLLCFIYGVVVTINIIYKARNKNREQQRSADILLANLKNKLSEQKNVPETDVSVSINSTLSYSKQSETLIETAAIEVDVHEVDKQTADLSQDELNQQEWDNPDNWGGTSWLEFYFSKNDSRTWVPKKNPLLGKTLNLAKPESAYWILAVVLLVAVPGVLVVLL